MTIERNAIARTRNVTSDDVEQEERQRSSILRSAMSSKGAKPRVAPRRRPPSWSAHLVPQAADDQVGLLVLRRGCRRDDRCRHFLGR